MPSGMQRVRLEAAHLGIDQDSAPSQVTPGKGLVVQNYLTGETGRLKQRGSILGSAIAHGALKKAIVGAWVGNDKVLLGYMDLKSMYTTPTPDVPMNIERHVAPRAGDDGNRLARAYDEANHMKLVDLKFGTVNDVTEADEATRSAITVYGKGTRVGRFVYGFGQGTANDTIDSGSFTIGQNDSGGHERITYMMRWNLATPTTAPVIYLCGPYGGQDMKFYYNKLFALGGRQPETGGGFIESNVVWYTREWAAEHHNLGFGPMDDRLNVSPAGTSDASETWPSGVPNGGSGGNCTQAASVASPMWMEEEDGVTPKRLNLAGDEQDYGVALAFVGRNLAILKRRSIIFLVGGDPDTWTLRTAVTGVGCLDPRSVVEANEGAYFLSQQGFMYFDGVQLHNASKGMERTLLAAGLAAVGDEANGIVGGVATYTNGFAVSERLNRDYIFLTIGNLNWSADGSADPAAPDVTFCGLYHIPTNSWSTFKSGLWSGTDDGPTYAIRSENRVGLFGHLNGHSALTITTPEQVPEGSRGEDVGNVSIETKWHSRLAELSMPFEKATIKRIVVDYEWLLHNDGVHTADTALTFDSSTQTDRLKVELVNGAGAVLYTFYLPRGLDADPDAETKRQRWTQDVFCDPTSEVQVRITYTGASEEIDTSSILDVFIEYQVSQERRN